MWTQHVQLQSIAYIAFVFLNCTFYKVWKYLHIFDTLLYSLYFWRQHFLTNILVLPENNLTCSCIWIRIFKICYYKGWKINFWVGLGRWLIENVCCICSETWVDSQHQDKKTDQTANACRLFVFYMHIHPSAHTHEYICFHILHTKRKRDRAGYIV